MNSQNKKLTKRFKTKYIVILASSLVLIIALIIAFNLIQKGDYSNPATQVEPPTAINSKDNEPADNIKSTIDPSITPAAPSGSFVSNHHPNLSGSPAPNTMSSSCNTTPNAYCKITFSQSGTTKELPTKQSDNLGNTYWEWRISDLGLGTGDWVIVAIAINGELTTKTTDSLVLNIQP